jgi:hypothetical protein
MILAGIVAGALMATGAAVMAMDSTLGRRAAYAVYRWRRRRGKVPSAGR